MKNNYSWVRSAIFVIKNPHPETFTAYYHITYGKITFQLNADKLDLNYNDVLYANLGFCYG